MPTSTDLDPLKKLAAAVLIHAVKDAQKAAQKPVGGSSRMTSGFLYGVLDQRQLEFLGKSG